MSSVSGLKARPHSANVLPDKFSPKYDFTFPQVKIFVYDLHLRLHPQF